jgi:signal peptidase I
MANKTRPLMKSDNKSGGWGETVRTIVYALLIALVVRTFAFQPFNIPSGSMIPTLLVGDYLFVSKYSYGYSRYSFPFGLGFFSGRILGSEPERGQIAVFRHPPRNDEDYIKRIIGLPGDRIQMKGGQLWINGQPVPRERIADEVGKDPYGRVRRVEQYVETLPNGTSYVIREALGSNGLTDTTREYVVPERHYFAMGDNRDESLDSRGRDPNGTQGFFVPYENLIGPAQFIFFSTDGTAGWFKPWLWPTATRWHRIFQSVD